MAYPMVQERPQIEFLFVPLLAYGYIHAESTGLTRIRMGIQGNPDKEKLTIKSTHSDPMARTFPQRQPVLPA